MADRIKVICVDDNADLAEMLEVLIRHEMDLEHLGTFDSGDRLVPAVEQLKPDVAIVDLTMAGRSPLIAVKEACERFPKTRSIMYSGRDDQPTITAAMDAGAWGFVSKHEHPVVLLDAVRRVARGEIVAPGV